MQLLKKKTNLEDVIKQLDQAKKKLDPHNFGDKTGIGKFISTAAAIADLMRDHYKQPGKKLHEWRPSEKLNALHRSLDIVTTWIPKPPGTDGFFTFYKDSIKAIAERARYIENEICRNAKLIVENQLDVDPYKDDKVWFSYTGWKSARIYLLGPVGSGVPGRENIADDAIKIKMLNKYRSLSSDLNLKLSDIELEKEALNSIKLASEALSDKAVPKEKAKEIEKVTPVKPVRQQAEPVGVTPAKGLSLGVFEKVVYILPPVVILSVCCLATALFGGYELSQQFSPAFAPPLVIEDPARVTYIAVSVGQTLTAPAEMAQQPTATVPAEIVDTLMETVTPTDTPEPTEVDHGATQTANASDAEELISEGLDHIDKLKDFYDEHECESWLDEARKAVEKCSQAIKLDPSSYEAYFCLGMGYYYQEDLQKVTENFEKVERQELSSEQHDEMMDLLENITGRIIGEPCSIGPVRFMSGWDSGYPINPSDTCGDIGVEINTYWEVYGSCNNTLSIRWIRDEKLTCYHFYKPDEHTQLEGSTYYFDDIELVVGTWGIEVWDGLNLIGKAECVVD